MANSKVPLILYIKVGRLQSTYEILYIGNLIMMKLLEVTRFQGLNKKFTHANLPKLEIY